MRFFPALLFTAGFALLAACQPRVQPQGSNAPTAAAAPQVVVAATGPAPQIVIDQAEYSAGTVKQGDTIQHIFVVRNRGLGELNIEKVKGS